MSTPENRLLAALPPDDFARLTARMTDVTLGHGDEVYSAGGPIEHVYFPRSGIVSAVIVMNDGQIAEAAAIGREGMIGASAFLGAVTSLERVFCQVQPSVCRKLPANEFVTEVATGGALRDIAHGYMRGVLTASARCTACNSLHPIDERCARWLLMCHDRVGPNEFTLTHEFLAIMLGCRRATVSVSAGSLQTAGIITYRHGKVTVLDRARLEEASCECYRVIREAFEIPR